MGILVQASFATKIVAVLEVIPNSEEVDLSISEFRHLTDELRTRARAILPRSDYSILTRDNILQLLSPDDAGGECLAESCAVEIGRAIGAEYVTQGFVGKFQEMLTLTVEFYESMSGNLLGSFVVESEDAKGLLLAIREKAHELFTSIQPIPQPMPQPVPQIPLTPDPAPQPLIPESQPKPPKSKTPFFIALGLDVLGAAVIGFGVYQHFEADKHYKNYENMDKNLEEQEYKDAYTNVKSAKTDRNVLYAVGGALLAAGITVHIWF